MWRANRRPSELTGTAPSRRSLLGGAIIGGTGLAAATMVAAPPAAATPPWEKFHVEHPGDDPDETSIQRALDHARDQGGGHVTVGAGRWRIEKQHLRIYAGTRLSLAPGTVLLRTGELTAMLSNGPRDGSDTTTAGYEAPGDIIVEGGVWDFNAREVPQPGWGLVFGHAANIIVQHLEIRDVSEWHAIEYNAIFNGVVDSCTIVGSIARPSAAWNQEAVSIDLAWPGLQPFGAGDHTQSQLIRVVNNYCEDWPTFAGCHSGYTDSSHDQFVFTGNTVRGLSYWGVSIRNVNRAVITGNTMSDVGGGVWVRPHDDPNYLDHRAISGIVVADNVIDTTTRDEGIRVFGVVDETLGDGRIYGSVVTGNVVRDTAKTGIVVRWAPEALVANNSVLGAGAHGVEVLNSSSAVVTGNYARDLDHHGLAVSHGEEQHIMGNTIANPARADEGGAGIHLAAVSHVSIQGNKVTSTAPEPAHAISADSDSSGIFYTNNDVRRGYAETPFDLSGTGHVDTPGNLS
ncbi:right-handed parallel beta-helix repeat-containing protein [Phytoactinopolyspora endophytica]|uniref:right-handed parallel beta-helix repeat-containing protein n=1 Tax=Phytoactinopolyspora endophytica TaxID=1642495 RepID=UPI00101D5971|nr:right-handed parallel beta-helix repeat-containing protein [Phytoactinopolyspora endophytica]